MTPRPAQAAKGPTSCRSHVVTLPSRSCSAGAPRWRRRARPRRPVTPLQAGDCRRCRRRRRAAASLP
eukprot:10031950-Lingulodinium_polyedra.AAC.1